MIIDVTKNYADNYLGGSYEQRLCYEMVFYVEFERIGAVFGDISSLDVRDFASAVNSGEIKPIYPRDELLSLIRGYLRGTHFYEEISPFLIYAIFICAKYNFGIIEKFLPSDEKVVEFLSDMMRIFNNNGEGNPMFTSFVRASGIEPRKSMEQVEAGGILSLNSILASNFIMEFFGEKFLNCRAPLAPLALLVVANFAIKYRVGSYLNFRDHNMFITMIEIPKVSIVPTLFEWANECIQACKIVS